ncbi:MAG: hypothetical protein Crog4KO_08000 [Crocinitomicaceae bacterium]
MKNALILLFLACSTAATTFAQDIHYVNLNASGNNDGTTWSDAFTDLQEALDSCYTSDTIWVAQGTYYGNYVKIDSQDVVLYGGFDGTETLESQRYWEANPTVLDGQNSGSVLTLENMSVGATIDGMYIQNGSGTAIFSGFRGGGINARYCDLQISNVVCQYNNVGSSSFSSGAGIFSIYSDLIQLENCHFIENVAGITSAILLQNGDSLLLEGCSFANNYSHNEASAVRTSDMTVIQTGCVYSENSGGAYYSQSSDSYFFDCVFENNYSDDGGAMEVDGYANCDIYNCIFTGNQASDKGGAIYAEEAKLAIYNSTFMNNSGDYGGAISTYDYITKLHIFNTLFYGNESSSASPDLDLNGSDIGVEIYNFDGGMVIENSLLHFDPSLITYGTYTATNNLTLGTDPQFIDTLDLDGPDDIWMTADDGLILGNSSPAMQTGTNTNATANDIVGTTRPSPPSIGAYENHCLVLPEPAGPRVSCQDVTTHLDSLGMASIDTTDLFIGMIDNCGSAVSWSVSDSTFDCLQLGDNTVTITALDDSGNAGTCTSKVTVIDTITAEPVCQMFDVYLDEFGLGSLQAIDLDGGSWDNCSLSFSASKTSFDCTDLGWDTLTLTVTELNGNQETCQSLVPILDSIQPITLAQNLDVYLDANGSASISVQDVDNGSSDNCGISNQTLSKLDFDCNDVGSNTVTLTNTDASGNTSATTTTVTVHDTITPTLFAQDVTLYLDGSGSASISSQDVDMGSYDNCGIAFMVLSDYNFNCNDLGANTVNYTITDVNGNVSTAAITVTVIDNIAPTISCQNITREIGASGFVSVGSNEVSTNSFDNCGSTLTLSQQTFDCSNLGSNVVMVTAVDAAGNTSTCSSVITIVDALAPQPIISSLPTITETCELTSLDEPSVIDNCSPVTISHDATLPITASTTVIWTYADTSGNVSYQAQSIVINSVDVAVLQTDDLTLESLNLGADGYQWIDCSTNQPISGETQYEYTATQNGNYAVIISEDGCQDTSACYTIDQVGISSLETETLRIAPNPVSGGMVRIYGAEQLKSIQVMDASGKYVAVEVDSELNQFGVNHLAPGTYFVQLTTETASVTRKLIVAIN